MSPARPASARRSRLLLSTAMVAALAASCVAVTPAAQAEPAEPARPAAQADDFDNHGGEVAGLGWQPKPMPEATLPAPVWPTPTTGIAAQGRAATPAPAVLERSSLPERWRGGVVARVSSAGQAVTMDYSKFEHAYGAGWASRLKLWKLPECALTTPDKAGCSATPLPSQNDAAKKTVTAAVGTAPAGQRAAAASAGTLVALAAEPAGDSGDYSATSLSPSSTWSAGGATGGFTWSYPMRTPSGIAGPQPEVALSYSSASADGRSSATNNQPSWVGEGFEYSPGFIERSYVPCNEDEKGSDNNPDQTGDLCWRTDNAVMSLGGTTAELIYQKGKGWHARAEDGSKIEKLTGASNGDHDGEHWKVTTTDGTQYFFGRDDLPGHSGDTASAWTVPVYGNHADEPGHASAFADSRETQAWRWNLDYVVDVRGNTMSYWYEKETNQYAAEVTESKNVSYVRGGSLARIEYGTWDRGAADRSVNPLAKVEFERADRCLSDCSDHDGSHWPDTPWDQECKADATSCQDFSPTFWSTKRLKKVTTQIWDSSKSPAAWQPVDSYTFEHGFPSPGDGQKGGLWLKSIVHAGHVGGTVTMPPVTLEGDPKPNRVLTKNNTTNNLPRLTNIYTETGARIQVTYSEPECSGAKPADPDNNTKLCYPVITPDPYDRDGPEITEWWHKYVVRKVSENDVQLSGGHQAPAINTYYTYEGDPAWHYADDDGLIKPKRKTWNQFRGYRTVTVQVGEANKTLTKTTYLRGMHGDRASSSGGTRTVTVGASMGSETVYDHDEFSGMVREEVVYNGTEDKPVSKTVNVPWRSSETASRTVNGDTVTARFVDTQATYTGTALGINGARGWRITGTKTDFNDAYGTVDSSEDSGDTSKTGDEKCTTHAYNRNTDNNIVTLPKQTTVTGLPCGSAATSPDHLISDVRVFYDKATSVDTDPVRGEVTRTDGLKDWTAAAGTTWQTSATTTFDDFGRTVERTDLKGNATTTAYAPAAGLVTKVTQKTKVDWTTVTDLMPHWGVPTRVEDPNKRVTDIEYDALGRTAKVWEVGWSKAKSPTRPSRLYAYSYSPERKAYPYVMTEALNAAGGINVSYQILDGLLRPRQTQTKAVGGGRVVTDTLYDAWGRAETTYGVHSELGDPSGALWWEPEWSVPTQNRTTYDRAGRATEVMFRSGDDVTNVVDKWKTTTVHEGDRTTTIPQKGGTTTTALVDAQGRTVEGRQYTTDAGAGGPFDTVKYTYDRKGQLRKVADAGLNEWSYDYDVRGRQIESRDPDKGRTKSEYNDFNELIKTTDGRGEVLAYTYDDLGRKTGLYDDSVADANKRAEWKYDVLFDGLPPKVRGQLTETIRYDGGRAYKWQARNFTDRYQLMSDQWVIPDGETGLVGSYVYSRGFSQYTGTPTTISYPSTGPLVPEQVTTGYDKTTGLPRNLTTNYGPINSYVSGQMYSAYGEPTVTTFRMANSLYTEESVTYERDTRRVQQVKIVPESTDKSVSDRVYSWEHNGNLLSITDTPQTGQSDTQCFDYDALQRLTSAWTPKAGVACGTAPTTANLGGPAPYWLDWTIDKVGNRTKEVSHSTAGDTTRTFAYPPSGAEAVRPHAVTGTTTTPPGQTTGTSAAYAYDATGNMITRPGKTAGQTLTWDAEGRPVKVEEGGQTTTNVYDADGNRLLRRDSTGTTLFLPGQELRNTSTTSPAKLTGTRYYSYAGKTVASWTAPGTQTVNWLFGDHQGTQQVSANAYHSGKIDIRRQDPYGGPRGTQPAWPTMKGFVNGDIDATGLTHIGAREYDAGLGRFISVDPVQDLAKPQQWNGYAYADNNPVTFSDPTGMIPIYDDGIGDGGKSPPLNYPDPIRKIRNDRISKGESWGGSGGDSKTSPLDVLNMSAKIDRTMEQILFSRGYQGTRNFTYGELLTFAAKRSDNWVYLCTTLGGQDSQTCERNNPLLPYRSKLEEFATVAVVGGVALGAVLCVAFPGACLAAGAEVAAGELAFASSGSMVASGGLIAGARLLGAACSFSGDTRVLMADGTTKAIEDVQVGDEVLATDPQTGEEGPRVVTQHWVHPDDLIKLAVDGEILVTTEDHPFWNATDKRWQRADELDAGDRLHTASQQVAAVGGIVDEPPRRGTAYNLTVADIHTYYVLAGTMPVLVHNTGPCTPGLVPGGVKNLREGAHMSTDDALNTAIEFVGPGYRDMGGGRFLSRDGLRQVRMTDADLAHPRQNPHMNFETYSNPTGPGVRSGGPVSNTHIYLPEESGWHTP